ncbi:MAG: GNAT family N-acetyltransferase [Bacillus sp. (in: Bacteria)]|nr:GNAT family N-acetyltransferase [Bacillus sp. (in: firmicutes)]
MIIRSGKPGDETEIAQVHVRSWQAAYRPILPADFLTSLSVKARMERWKNGLQQANHGTFVAEDSQRRIVGFANGGKNRGTDDGTQNFQGELYSLYLLPEVWGKGVGIQLVNAVASHLQLMEFSSMIVWVLSDNPATTFYEKIGGEKVAVGHIPINGKNYPERAYGWKDISVLNKKIEH